MAVATSTALLIAGGVAAGASIYGANKAANAATAAGNAQVSAAATAEANQRADRATAYAAATKAAMPSPQEIATTSTMLQRSTADLTSQLAMIQKGQDTLDSVEPAVKEAGAQTLQLLKGQQAAVLTPLMNARSVQRDKLEQTLASRFGPGYKTTAAGIMALNGFDNDTATTVSNAQFQALSQVSGIAGSLGGLYQQGTAQNTAAVGNAYGTAQNLDATALGSIAQNRGQQLQAVNELTQSPVNYNNSVNAAGLPFSGDIAGGKSISSFGGAVGQSAITGFLDPKNGLVTNNSPTNGFSIGTPQPLQASEGTPTLSNFVSNPGSIA